MSKPFPHHHHPFHYAKHDSLTDLSFQAMLMVWYQVADMLRHQPPGTLLRYACGTLVMGALNGELFMFDSPDVSPGDQSTDFNLFRPQDFEGIDEHEFDAIRKGLLEVLASRPVFTRIDPQILAKAIEHNFRGSSIAEWCWEGACAPTHEG